ncbi:MAG: hypothetical protein AAFX01_09430 [Cyanobacteria bacterium J06638_28]
MDQSAIDFFRLLVQVGAVPGEDFSCDATQQAYRLNERCYHLLRTAYPDADWHAILNNAQPEPAQLIEQLHAELGCPFVHNLVQRILVRLKTLPETEAVGYCQALLNGVGEATGIMLYPFLVDELDMTGQVRLEWLLRQPVRTVPYHHCLLDLVQAVECADADYEITPEEAWLTETGQQRLSRVWNAEFIPEQAEP